MTIHPVLLYIWAALALGFMALLIYRGHLTRYEDEQLFLNEDVPTVEKNKMQKETIVRQIQRMKPLIQACGVAAGLVTTTVVSIYVYNAWQNIQ